MLLFAIIARLLRKPVVLSSRKPYNITATTATLAGPRERVGCTLYDSALVITDKLCTVAASKCNTAAKLYCLGIVFHAKAHENVMTLLLKQCLCQQNSTIML